MPWKSPLGSLVALGKRNANDNRSQIQTIFVFPVRCFLAGVGRVLAGGAPVGPIGSGDNGLVRRREAGGVPGNWGWLGGESGRAPRPIRSLPAGDQRAGVSS